MAKTKVIYEIKLTASASIATKAKGSLIDGARLCSFGFHAAMTK